MSDYYGADALEDWLQEEVFPKEKDQLPPEVVALFEDWREAIEETIRAWWETDKGDGGVSWRSWGFGFKAIPTEDEHLFNQMFAKGREMLKERKENNEKVRNIPSGQVEFHGEV